MAQEVVLLLALRSPNHLDSEVPVEKEVNPVEYLVVPQSAPSS